MTDKTPKGFDPKANKAEINAERTERAAGKEVKTAPYTVLKGEAVRQGGDRFTEGDVVHLTPADAERLVARRVVAPKGAKAEAKADTKAPAKADGKADGQA